MNVLFLTPLRVEKAPGDFWELTSPMAVQLVDYRFPEGIMDVVVPAGFQTDFASVPRIPGVYLMFGGVGEQAAALHDWLYSAGAPGIDRATADEILREALAVCGVPTWKTWAMWCGVRIGGRARYAGDRQ